MDDGWTDIQTRYTYRAITDLIKLCINKKLSEPK